MLHPLAEYPRGTIASAAAAEGTRVLEHGDELLDSREVIADLDDLNRFGVTFNGGKYIAVHGASVVVAFDYDGELRLFRRSPASGRLGTIVPAAWTHAATLSPGRGETYRTPAIGFRSDGTLVVAYVRVTDEVTVCMAALVQDLGSTPVVREYRLDGRGASGADYPALHVDEDDGVHVVWESSTGDQGLHIEYSYLAMGALTWTTVEASRNRTPSSMTHVVPTVAASVASDQVVIAWKKKPLDRTQQGRWVYYTSARLSDPQFPSRRSFLVPRLIKGGSTASEKAMDPGATVTPSGRFFVGGHSGGGSAFVVEGDDPYGSGFTDASSTQFSPSLCSLPQFIHLVADDEHVVAVYPGQLPVSPWLINTYFSRGTIVPGTRSTPWEDYEPLPEAGAEPMGTAEGLSAPGITWLQAPQTGVMGAGRASIEDWGYAKIAEAVGALEGFGDAAALMQGRYAVVEENGEDSNRLNFGKYVVLGAAGSSLDVEREGPENTSVDPSEPYQDQVTFTLLDLTMCVQPSVAMDNLGHLHLVWVESPTEKGDWNAVRAPGQLCYRTLSFHDG